MKDLKTMGYYFNVTRTDQVVQIIDLKKDKVWYQVIRQYDQNTITEFCCTRERFNNLYLPKQ
jgi:myo-inositol-hexaphosphate 3-phosphohydrolase